MQSVAHARVGAKSRPGPLLDSVTKNVAGRRMRWRVRWRYYAWRISGEQRYGGVSLWRITGELIVGETGRQTGENMEKIHGEHNGERM